MTDISNKKYLRITPNGVLSGDKVTLGYRGIEIHMPEYAVKVFNEKIKPFYPDVEEVHVLSSETVGRFANSGNPSSTHGTHAWCRAMFNDKTVGDWVFYDALVNPDFCAATCAVSCVRGLRSKEEFCSAVFAHKTR